MRMGAGNDAERFARVLGEAVIARWSTIPQPLQQELFGVDVAGLFEARQGAINGHVSDSQPPCQIG